MALPEEITNQIEQGDVAAIEDAWLLRMGEDPGDFGYFVTVARGLVAAEQEDVARLLLDMLDEHLRDGGQWALRLDLMREAGDLLMAPEDLHAAVLATLEALHGNQPSYASMVEKVGLHRAVDNLPKTWLKADRLKTLLAFDVGTIVAMGDKGPGRVLEANMALESFNVDFELSGPLRIGFRAAPKVLEVLAPDHILRRKLEDPAPLEALRDDDPPELLRLVLESYQEPRTGAEIRRDLAGIVADARWSSWWAAARKHPQLLAVGKGRRSYRWASSSAAAEDAVWASFETAAPRAQLALLRRDGARDEALRRRMAASLVESAAAAAAEDPGLACEIWLNLDRLGSVAATVPWSAPSLVANVADLRPLARGVEDRVLRERVYELARAHRAGWADELALLIAQEVEPRALDRLAAYLAEVEGGMERQIAQLLSQPRRSPAAFTWLAERAAENERFRRYNPLRLLKQLLWTLSDQTFAPFRQRLSKLIEPGGTVPSLLIDLDERQAAEALIAIDKAAGSLDYHRRPLQNAILVRFPSLREDEVQPLYATAEVIATKRAELRTLLEEEIPANRRAIEEAREMGDLRENFEYKSARQRHEYLSARATELDADLNRARPIDASTVSGSEVVIGSRVSLRGDGDAARTITILGPWNSEPEKNILSNESELAQQLLGEKKGAVVELAGGEWEIVAIEPYA